jgi:peptidoglycan/xylan/chitin deacetylase (PgdA/CDA1 family)
MRETAARPFPVLVFHSVADRAGSSIWTLPTGDFRRHAEAIAASGRTSLTFGELAEALHERRVPPDAVVVTFDDGFADNIPAAEVCAELGLRATVFVTTDYIGRERMLTDDQVRELAAMPNVEVGSHTLSHRRLDELPRHEIHRELHDSRARLEILLSSPVTTLAYPHGNYDERVKGIAADLGYRGAAAVRLALSHPGDDPYAVARHFVTTGTTDAEVAALLAGTGRVAPRHERVVTRGYRWVRRARAMARGGTTATPPAA